ncbi:MAG: hypothetical protein GY714_25410 [Desulfobacterales bacterium]|nr:hypothetical protein [Desulfobacterales bacterium]
MGKDDEKVENGEKFQNYSKLIYLQLLGFFHISRGVEEIFEKSCKKKG